MLGKCGQSMGMQIFPDRFRPQTSLPHHSLTLKGQTVLSLCPSPNADTEPQRQTAIYFQTLRYVTMSTKSVADQSTQRLLIPGAPCGNKNEKLPIKPFFWSCVGVEASRVKDHLSPVTQEHL